MSRFTDRLYWAWRAQNRSGGGMGAVAPMKAQNTPAKSFSRVQSPAPAQVVATRPEKPL